MYISALCQRRDSLGLLKSRDYSKPRVLQNFLSTYLINLRHRYDNWDWPSQKQKIYCSSSNKIIIIIIIIVSVRINICHTLSWSLLRWRPNPVSSSQARWCGVHP
jgi:hypothetical protein